MSADLDDLRERITSYRDLAELSALYGMTELAEHADTLARKYEAELRDLTDQALCHLCGWTVTRPADSNLWYHGNGLLMCEPRYVVPTDPADATSCEACQ